MEVVGEAHSWLLESNIGAEGVLIPFQGSSVAWTVNAHRTRRVCLIWVYQSLATAIFAVAGEGARAGMQVGCIHWLSLSNR